MAEVKRYVLVNAQNRIVNRCLWDGERQWTPPDGLTAVLESDAIAQGLQDHVDGEAPRTVTPREFRKRLTRAEQRAITAAAASNADLRLWMDDLEAAVEVDLNSVEVAAGLDVLVGAGLLTAQRKSEILA